MFLHYSVVKTKTHISEKSLKKKNRRSHITANLLKTSGKEKILKVARGKSHHPEKRGDRRCPIRGAATPRCRGKSLNDRKTNIVNRVVYTQKNIFQE